MTPAGTPGSIHIPAEQPDPSKASPVSHSSFPTVAATQLTLAGLTGCAKPSADSDPAPAAPTVYTPAQASRADIAPGLYEPACSAHQNAVFVASFGCFGKAAAASKILRLDPATLAVQRARVYGIGRPPGRRQPARQGPT